MNKIPHCRVFPKRILNLLSMEEIEGLTTTRLDLAKLFRDCSLAILNSDSNEDDAARILAEFSDFDIRVLPHASGLVLDIHNAPAQSFVDGEMIGGIRDHLFAALRDILYVDYKLSGSLLTHAATGSDITNAVFRILRQARIFKPTNKANLVVCWGGHSIPREEYDFSKEVGFQMGLRGLDIITGCGIGAMKGPMKGAAIGHAKQQNRYGRYIGISEPGIIASESPNAIVNELVIMPDIEKRLEAFVRLAHGIVVFPGGVGTLEEILYLLAILLSPDNTLHIPLVFAGPENCRDYFEKLDRFIGATLGEKAQSLYQIEIGSPKAVARVMKEGMQKVQAQCVEGQRSYHFNWELAIDSDLQKPFLPTHEAMESLTLLKSMPKDELATQLRAAFSGLVAGNVKAFGIQQVAERGPYRLSGDPEIMRAMDNILKIFVEQGRMKLGKGLRDYQPCYQLA